MLICLDQIRHPMQLTMQRHPCPSKAPPPSFSITSASMSSHNAIVICRDSSVLDWIPEWRLPILLAGTIKPCLTAVRSACKLHMLHKVTTHNPWQMLAISCCCADAISVSSTCCVCYCLQSRHNRKPRNVSNDVVLSDIHK